MATQLTLEEILGFGSVFVKNVAGSDRVPDLPVVNDQVSVDYCPGKEFLPVFIANLKGKTGLSLLQALASATMSTFGFTDNITGSKVPPNRIDIVGTGADPTVPKGKLYIKGGQTVPINGTTMSEADAKKFAEYELIELAAALGNCYHALGKAATAENLPAFTTNRQAAVEARMVSRSRLFVANSELFTLEFLQNLNDASISFPHITGNMIAYCAEKSHLYVDAVGLGFAACFQLLEGHGMTTMSIIQDGLRLAPWIIEDFPEAKAALPLFIRAVNAVRSAGKKIQGYLKVIHQQNFIPYPPTEKILSGICYQLVRSVEKTMENYTEIPLPGGLSAKLAQKIVERDFLGQS